MKGLLLRSASGIVYVAVIVCGLLLGPVVFKVFMSLFAVLALVEFYGLCNRHSERVLTLLVDVAGGVIGVLGLFALATGSDAAVIYGAIYLGYLVARLVMQLYTLERNPLNNLAYSFMGQMYIVLGLGLMSFIWQTSGDNGYLLLAMFIMIWLNDTGAYCVGSTLGRHKMFPRVSPKKSWEGFVGGVVFAVASAFLFKGCFGSCYESLSLGQMLGMGAVVSLFATWGDLIESLVKRTLGVKDSGNLIPGHGGILDRIDSLLLVVPALVVYLQIIM